MISGYLSSQQDFVDLINSYLFNKQGVLEIYLEGRSIELYVENGYIKGFYTETEGLKAEEINKKSLLLYSLFDILDILDIGQFSPPEVGKNIYEVDYILRDVSMKNVSMFSVLESLIMDKFTGFINIYDNYNNYELYIQKGKPIALYPYNFGFFNILLTPRADLVMNVVSMPEEIINKFILKHSNRRLISGLPDSFIELGKTFIGIIKSGFTGLLMLQKANERMYFAYDNGILLASLLENEKLKICNADPYKDGFLVDLISFEPMENFLEVMHLLFINVVYGVILKHSNQMVQSILHYLSSSDLFKMIEGNIYFRVNPKGRREEILSFLSFLLDVGYKILGKKKLEEELENSLHPYRDIFKVLEIEEYAEFWNEGAIS
jgi:hypothetical protein